MEDAFETQCKLLSNGSGTRVHLHGRTESGAWTSRASSAIHITDEERAELTSLLKEAEKGPFSDTPAICDAGTLIIQGQLEKKHFITILDSRDCEPSRTNLSPAAKKIQARLSELCHLIP